MMRCAASVAVLLLNAMLVAPSTLLPLQVTTDGGPVVGMYETLRRAGDGATVTSRSFRGIPFAAAPVGSLRWQPPGAAPTWTSPRNSTVYGPGCPQKCDLPPFSCPSQISEDCLYLNVWTPATASVSPLPVLFFIHGGHFEQGSGEGPLYDSAAAGNLTDVVVVTTNYRLGALGWMSTGQESGDLLGNFGLLDQIAALQWTQQNIGAFGGDPDRVTVYGQSAGGTSVSSLLVSPQVQQQKLFHQAIVESNPFGLPCMSSSDAKKLSARMNKDVGCGDSVDIGCMMSKSWQDVVTAQSTAGKIVNFHDLLEIFYPWSPAIGAVVPDQPLNLFLAGKSMNIPMIVGTVGDEGRLFVYSAFGNKTLSGFDYEAIVTATFGLKHFLKVLHMYPSSKDENKNVLSDLASDYLFTCPLRAAARKFSTINPSIWEYRFTHAWSFDGWGPNFAFCFGYACHGSELPFVFDVTYLNLYKVTAGEVALGRSMVEQWSQFAKNGAPNMQGWTRFNGTADLALEFDATASAPSSHAITGLRKPFCDFWDSIGYNF